MFATTHNDEHDVQLCDKALDGDKTALETLLKNHQDYVYNISLRLFLSPDDALDATQEVLIKVVTHLKTFNKKSKFRTWLYRIAVNHFLNVRKKKMEIRMDDHTLNLNAFQDDGSESLYDEKEIEEVRILCSTAMLQCLNREQRLIYIIGEVFQADHTVGAELFGITPANYRVKLHRAKSDLLNYVAGKCGLINAANPCRCPKKTNALIKQGVVNKDMLLFNADFNKHVRDIVRNRKDEVSDKVQLELKELFHKNPFQIKEELDSLVQGIIK